MFVFAAQNTDYWSDFLAGRDYPAELTEDETLALEGARKHVEDIVVEVLHEAGTKLR